MEMFSRSSMGRSEIILSSTPLYVEGKRVYEREGEMRKRKNTRRRT
jgi:hypothetical protein